MGVYINADDIVRQIKAKNFTFDDFSVKVVKNRLQAFAIQSGLLSGAFTEKILSNSYHIRGNRIYLKDPSRLDQLGQIVARFLRETMLELKRRFSFETVFSHESNIKIMEQAVQKGYKVYLYFVSTESPEINKFRVSYRVRQHGHDVPVQKIIDRYTRSLELLYDAAQLCHQAYFFDNSRNGEPFTLTGHFKRIGKRKVWDKIPKENIAKWFEKYYLEKEKKIKGRK